MATRHYEAVIIGSGQGGDPLARAFAKAGRKTAIIERDRVGGTCINWGCTPTKTMIASARVAHLAGRGEYYGVQTGPVRIDMERVRERKQQIVESFRSGTEASYAKIPALDLIRGEARFTGPKTLEIRAPEGEDAVPLSVTADLIFIDTGLRSSLPPIEGLSEISFLDNISVMELGRVPEHLIVLGGGYVGVEFAQMFRRFGSRVTLVERGQHILAQEDADVAEVLQQILVEDGIEILTETEASSVRQPASESWEIAVRPSSSKTGESRTLHGSHLLVALGRTPNTDALNLGAAGVRTDEKGYVQVDDRLETTAPGVYALGDVKGGPAFTHISYDDFRVLRGNLLEGKSLSIQDRIVPYVVFTDPQLGRVGLTEKAARDRGLNVRVATLPVSDTARGLESGESRGVLKAVVDAESQQILGAAILCVEGGEIMTAVEVAMMAKLPYPALKEATLAHPTMAESLNNLFMKMDGNL